ncbi:MAG: hypothetical protein HY282_18300 [Nitrospirae bacterium]|nr:hypothetical protein [Candidatus Manganitrophaceae bacterium]
MFSLVAVWAVLLAIPTLRRPPPGFEPRICPSCDSTSKYDATQCEKCGAKLEPRKLG